MPRLRRPSISASAQIGSYPFWREGRPGANFVIRSPDPHVLAACAEALMEGLRNLGIDPVDGEIG